MFSEKSVTHQSAASVVKYFKLTGWSDGEKSTVFKV